LRMPQNPLCACLLDEQALQREIARSSLTLARRSSFSCHVSPGLASRR
ncbi:hypothetical protein A2U01_0104312, partial [Trifolium medium]|nr:hypothetical protein [Trifolium medium]